jgi:phage terminase large subunit-like protein
MAAPAATPLITRDPDGQKFCEQLVKYPCYGGLDLAAVSDLTAFSLVWLIKQSVYVHVWFWIPEDGLLERSKKDNVRYDLWAKQGLVELTPGPVTDWGYCRERIKELDKIFDIKQIGFDRHGARDTVSDLANVDIEVVDVGQGYISLSAPSKYFESLVLSGKLVHSGHQVLRWNVDCTAIAQDESAANIKPVKPNRQKSSKRIDGVVATIIALRRLQASIPTPKWGLMSVPL